MVFLLLEDSDAQWDATLRAVLKAADDSGALSVFLHAVGVGESDAATLRMERALERARDARAAAVADEQLVAALSTATVVLAAGGTIEQSLAQVTAAAGTAPSADMEREMRTSAATLRLSATIEALESGEFGAPAARASRAVALALLPAGDAVSVAVVAELDARLEKACARAERQEAARQRAEAEAEAQAAAAARAAAAEAVVRAAADEAAAAEAAAMPLSARLQALPRWQAALGAAASADSAAAISLARSLAHVRDATELSARLAAAATPPPAADALPYALAALSAARDAAAAAPDAVRGALVTELQVATLRSTQWAALVELAAAAASADVGRITVAMTAANAVGADPDAIVRAMLTVPVATAAAATSPAATVAATPPSASAPAASSKPTAPGEWLPAGPRLWFDVSTQLGTGSRGTVVHPGVHLSERGRSAEPCAVKRLRRNAGEAGKKQLEFMLREIENLTKLNACSQRVAFFFGHHEEQDFLYMAFELFDESLLQRLQRAPLLSPAQRIATLAAVAAALRDCHAAGVAHNDVHAGNVLLKDGGATVKLTDVQLSVRVTGAIKNDGYSFTTFQDKNVQINMACRAPEMQNPEGKVTAAVDVWALGALAFFLLSGKENPFASAKRTKFGPGGGGGGGRAPSAFSDAAAESLRIARGEHDLSALDACGLPKHAAAEARHLLSACLSKDAFLRPAAAAVPGHPLFWDAAATADALVTLRRRRPSEETMRSALARAAVPDAAYARLAGWRAVVHAPLLACAPPGIRVLQYKDGLVSLLRFARNALEHLPPPGALPPVYEPPPGTLDEDARRAAVVAYLRDAWPELALAAHAGLLATAGDAATAVSTRRTTKGGADDDD
jgi:serine/threonine protein kinase